MNTDMTWQTSSTSLEDTVHLAEQLGRHLRGGEVIELVSDLGGGKTSFVRGLTRGAGSYDHVASPTFTISREYRAGKLTLYHFDFYRLGEPGLMADELHEIIADPQAVTVIEWADIVKGVLPEDHMTITFQRTGETARKISFSYPPAYAYLLNALRK